MANESEIRWKEFMDWLNNHQGMYIYRGVSNKLSYFLKPWIGRLPNYSIDKEIDLFEHFKLKANQFTTKSYNDYEWLVMAQHHGLPTRLLDWTFNPLIAAFFAVDKNESKSGRIYAYRPDKYSFVDFSEEKSPFEINRIKFLIPP